VDISSSNFPRLVVNPNSGEPVGGHTHAVKCNNTVYIGADLPAHALLPIIPED
jgi:predicted acyl esterase